MTPVIYINAGVTGPFFNLKTSKSLNFCRDPCHIWTKSRQRVTVLLAGNADGTNKLPPLVTGKCCGPHGCKNVKKNFRTKYDANTNSLITSNIFEDCLAQLDRNVGTKISKNPAFRWLVYCWLKEHNIYEEHRGCIFPSKLYQPSTSFVFGNHPCIPSAITGSSSAVMIDGGQLQDASRAKLNMLFAVHCLA